MALREPCWQCDLDIPHTCYHGIPVNGWGMTDTAVAAMDAANRYLRTGSPFPVEPATARTRKKLARKSPSKRTRTRAR